MRSGLTEAARHLRVVSVRARAHARPTSAVSGSADHVSSMRRTSRLETGEPACAAATTWSSQLASCQAPSMPELST